MMPEPVRYEYQPPQAKKERFMRLRDVLARTGLSRSTVYFSINQNQFPKPIPISARCVAWLESDIEVWMNNRINLSRQRA